MVSTVLVVAHAVGMIKRARWAILIAGLPYLALAVWGIQSRVNLYLTTTIKWNESRFLDQMISWFMICLHLAVFIAAVRIAMEILEERRQSASGKTQVVQP